MKKNNYFLFLLIAVLLFSACSPKRNLVYFSDLNDSTAYVSQILNDIDPKIKSGDILGITVNTLNLESNQLFNQGTISTQNNTSTPLPTYNQNISPSAASSEGYLIDKEGNINFPVIGKIKLAGLSREQARELMVTKITKYVKDPIVNIRFLNFRISVIGEVNRPGSFIIPNEKINVLEGLGLAGDMTGYGRRENVLVIREVDGKRTMARLDLNEQKSINSPYFYLQQNDVIYVEPDNLKEKNLRNNYQVISIVLSAASVLTILLTNINWSGK